MTNTQPGGQRVLLALGATLALLCSACGDERSEAELGDFPIEAVVERLDREDPQDRYQAALELARRGAAAVAPLEAYLLRWTRGDASERPPIEEEHDPREIAARTLQRIGKPAVPALLRALEAPEDYERRLAQMALVEIGVDASHTPRLLALLQHENPMTAGFAAHHITALGPEVEAELEALRAASSDPTLRTRLLRTALSMEGIDHDPWLERELASDDPKQRLAILQHVAQLPGSRWLSTLAAHLGDPDRQIRLWSATTLVKRGAQAREALAQVLREGTREAQAGALPIVGQLGSDAEELTETVAAFEQSEDALLRVRAILALQKIKNAPAHGRDALLALPPTADVNARVEAAGVLAEAPIELDDVTGALVAYVGHPEPVVALRALESLEGRTLDEADRKELNQHRERFDDERNQRIIALLETS